MASLGFSTDTNTKTLDDITRDINNLRMRLESQGVDAKPEKPRESLFAKALKVVNTPGAVTRSLIKEGIDDESGINWNRVKEGSWEKQTEGIELLDELGLAPEEGEGFGRKATRFALGLGTDIATDPLTILSGGIVGGLKLAAPFTKGVQLTQKGLLSGAKMIPYLDEGKVVAKTIPDAWERLTKGTKQIVPAKTAEELAQAIPHIDETQKGKLVERLFGKQFDNPSLPKPRKPKFHQTETVVENGMEVRLLGSKQTAQVLDVDRNTGKVILGQWDDAAKKMKRVEHSISKLRDAKGNVLTTTTSRASFVRNMLPTWSEDRIQWLLKQHAKASDYDFKGIVYDLTDTTKRQTKLELVDALFKDKDVKESMVEAVAKAMQETPDAARQRLDDAITNHIGPALDKGDADMAAFYLERITRTPMQEWVLTAEKASKERSRLDRLAKTLGKQLEKGPTEVWKPGPLAPVANAVGKMFSTTYGRNPELISSFKSLQTTMRNTMADAGKSVKEIAKKAKLTDAEDKLLLRLAEEPEQRTLYGVTKVLNSAPSVQHLSPELQEAIMRALPELEGGTLRPELIQALNDLQGMTRGIAAVPEVELGWLGPMDSDAVGRLRPDYVHHEMVSNKGGIGFGGKRTISNNDMALLPRAEGTVAELNALRREKGMKTLYDENLTTSTFARVSEAIQATQSFKWVKESLGNPEWARNLDEYAKDAVSALSPEDAAKQMEAFGKLKRGDKLGNLIVWEGSERLKDVGKHLVTEDMYEVLNHVEKFYMGGDEGINAFVGAFDWVTNKWKPWVTLRNPAFHLNNLVGNLWNSYLGGLAPKDMPLRYRQASDILRGKEGAIKLFGEGVDNATIKGLAVNHGVVGHAAMWQDGSLKALREELQAGIQNKGLLKRMGAAYDDWFKHRGSGIEDGSKLALFIDAMQKLEPNADILAKQGKEAALNDMANRAALHTKKYLFDYSDLTQFERQIMRRVAPFYAWTRKNLPLQVAELVNQPGKFARLEQIRHNADNIEPEDPNQPKPQFLQEALRTPLHANPDATTFNPFSWFTTDEKGEPIYFNPRLPAQDLARLYPGDAGREGLGMLNPLLKVPLELATGQNFFTGRPIERYPGETEEIIGGGRWPVGGIRGTFAMKEAFGAAGRPLDLATALAEDAGATERLRALRFLFPGIYSYSRDKEKVNAAYREADRLKNLMRKYEDESKKQVPTLRDLRKQDPLMANASKIDLTSKVFGNR